MASDWRVHCIQNTHRHPLWCWTHWDCCPNSEQTEVYLKKRKTLVFIEQRKYWNLGTKISALLFQMKFKRMRMKIHLMILPFSNSQTSIPIAFQPKLRTDWGIYIHEKFSFYSKKKIWKSCDNFFHLLLFYMKSYENQ